MKTYRLQYILCGKRCKGCPHGPYWYAFWKDSGKTRSAYVGKQRRGETGDLGGDRNIPETSHAWSGILHRRTASIGLACTILECMETSSREAVDKAYSRLARIHHPDRGGDGEIMTYINVAYSFVKAWHGWH